MPNTTRVTLADAQALARLLGECRELGDDPLVWRHHFMASLGKLVDAEAAAGAEMQGCLAGGPTSVGAALWGFDAGLNPEGLRIIWEWSAIDPFKSQLWREVHRELSASTQGVTAPRQQLLADRQWLRTEDYQQVMWTMEAEEVLHSFHPIPGGDDLYDGICWFRARGRARFNERDVTLISLVHQEVARLVGGPLARWNEPSPSQLPPRVRSVLHCLLEGDADKQIAARLTLSPHTVNQYTKQIFRHFRVASRSELLARWLRRGWTTAAAWDKPNAQIMVIDPALLAGGATRGQ